MSERIINHHVVTYEMFEAFLNIKNKYVHDEKSFRHFFFYLDEFKDLVRVDMNDTAILYKLPDHYHAAAERLGEHRQTIWRATKK